MEKNQNKILLFHSRIFALRENSLVALLMYVIIAQT